VRRGLLICDKKKVAPDSFKKTPIRMGRIVIKESSCRGLGGREFNKSNVPGRDGSGASKAPNTQIPIYLQMKWSTSQFPRRWEEGDEAADDSNTLPSEWRLCLLGRLRTAQIGFTAGTSAA
jgi:hypothetical protein